mmetsp:Transcript_93683/g.265281  ORF Transcript_93683/g.265281 Transcript_93683/m.265281 type:complete len:320 (-) Transcript_93683:233-1192(-)
MTSMCRGLLQSMVVALGGGKPARKSRAWKVVPDIPLRPRTLTIWPGNAATDLHSATLSCARTLFEDALEPSSRIERSLSRPSRPSQATRPQSTASAWDGTPTVPTRMSSPTCRAHIASATWPSRATSRASRASVRSLSVSSIQLYEPLRSPVQSLLSPRSSHLTGTSTVFSEMSRFPSFTEDVRETCSGLTGDSGAPFARAPSSPSFPFAASLTSRSRFGYGVLASASPRPLLPNMASTSGGSPVPLVGACDTELAIRNHCSPDLPRMLSMPAGFRLEPASPWAAAAGFEAFEVLVSRAMNSSKTGIVSIVHLPLKFIM